MAEEEAALALNSITQANNQFTFDLYNVLAQDSGNLFFSPVSIHVILALIFLGARGDTAKQIAKGLHLPEERNLTEYGVNALMHRLKDSSYVTLDIANKVYLKPGFNIKDEFNQSSINFMAGLEEVDFSNEDEARKIINGWVEEATHQKIKDMIPKGYLDDRTLMVLINAIYFKGDWAKQFNKVRTRRMPFHLLSSATKQVDMMYTEGDFNYVYLKELDSQALLLPYKGQRISMMILLPKEVNGLPNLEKNLLSIDLHHILRQVYETEVHVYLPKFKLEYEKELQETLRKLGITSVFEPTADLGGISDLPLEVSKALHKAFIEVNEEGTEAAAATAVLSEKIDSVDEKPPRPVIFKADRQFMFFIVDHQSSAVLFAGRFAGPPAPTPSEAAAFAQQFPEHQFAWGPLPVAANNSKPHRLQG
ncbi:leukocyte elastase inhibitor-like isoform X1 [Schistocerca serialis cubense]|uniref:leukocyte elastase inhibitor-like isoform X1 n=1 Tax=Schistocerca serialis cubense TaxID=2023355 RepID=UPI00214E18E7|nr:leukocyte elastase inhibitor-like isoform X1 [Schistocerca serialis cubense]